jgi:hypothetical protein
MQPMLDAIEGHPFDAALRRFACACCRRMWVLLPRECRQAVEVSERYAAANASTSEFATANEAAHRGYKRVDRQYTFKKVKIRTQARAALAVAAATSPDAWQGAKDVALAYFDLFGEHPVELLREYVVDPFGTVRLTPVASDT